MIQHRIERFLDKRCTLLGVGPMSTNCVDATIELANDHEVPIFLIATRRQIDARDLGGGYVNNWCTEDFAEYVFERDRKGWVILARDHGGPWQSDKDLRAQISLPFAMEHAKTSFRADIQAGVQCLHIDPSKDLSGAPPADVILDRLYELYEFCWREAQDAGRHIIFEVGTEEQTGSAGEAQELEHTLSEISSFCRSNSLPLPVFVVVQTGTRVMETRNVGSLDSPVRITDELAAEIQVPRTIEMCGKYGVYLKEHNADYLSDEALNWHPRLGIHAVNVAPQFGVTETRSMVKVMEEHGMGKQVEDFLELAYSSGKWEKWMLPDSQANDRERAIICGHYLFATEACEEIKTQVKRRLSGAGLDLDDRLRSDVKEAILRYLRCLRVVRA